MEDNEEERESNPTYLLRFQTHDGQTWYYGCNSAASYFSGLFPPSSIGPQRREQTAKLIGIVDGNIVNSGPLLFDDYAGAYDVMQMFQDAPYFVYGQIETETAGIQEVKANLLTKNVNPVFNVETGVASASVVNFHDGVFIELCATRYVKNPDAWTIKPHEDPRLSYDVKVAESYLVYPLLRYPLTYRKKENEPTEQTKTTGQDQ
jgi:hypothetical protein